MGAIVMGLMMPDMQTCSAWCLSQAPRASPHVSKVQTLKPLKPLKPLRATCKECTMTEDQQLQRCDANASPKRMNRNRTVLG
jgi:hypothetical protein